MATIVAYEDFDAAADCEAIHGAMDGLGTDEDVITGIISQRSNDQRQEMKAQYATMFGEELVDALKNELGGKYEDVVLALFKPIAEYDAWCLHEAIHGGGTDEKCIIEILVSRTNEEIEAIKEAYAAHEADLLEDLQGDLGGNFGKLMYSLAQGTREDCCDVDDGKAHEEAQALFDAGEGSWGTEESRFNVVLANRSFNQIILTLEAYEEISEKTLEEAIKGEFSGDLEEGMLAIVKCAKDRTAYFAERLYKTMKGAGTDDQSLIRLMVSRSEKDLADIKAVFENMYEQTLDAFIEDDCNGDYKKLLILICHGNA